MQEDDICRIAFADAGMTRRALELLPKRATAELDPRRLRRLPTEHVASGGQRRRADMAWAVGTLGSKAEALLALEFQSSPDRAMALRMEVYAALLRQEVAAEGGLRAGGLLPRVLPVVLYTGARRWRPQTLGGPTAPTPAGWGGWQARFEFLLLDATALTAEDGRSNPAAALLRLLASRNAESLPAMAKTLFEQLRPAGSGAPAEQERRAFAKRLARALMRMLIARFAGAGAGGIDIKCSRRCNTWRNPPCWRRQSPNGGKAQLPRAEPKACGKARPRAGGRCCGAWPRGGTALRRATSSAGCLRARRMPVGWTLPAIW